VCQRRQIDQHSCRTPESRDDALPKLTYRHASMSSRWALQLATYFLERHRTFRPLSLSTAATDALLAYDWPGNVRELERVIERAVALAGGPFLELDDLPPALLGDYAEVLLPALHDGSTMREWGSRYARLVLERCSNNKRQACRQLGISYHRGGTGENGSRGGSLGNGVGKPCRLGSH
jgi:transcriptional regulator of acetoin/glycerol metabolism